MKMWFHLLLRLTTFLLVATVTHCQSDNPKFIGSNEFDRKLVIEAYNVNLNISWHVNLKEENITFSVIASTEGYVGFGFSNNTNGGSMKDADMIIGGVFSNKTVYFEDRYSDDGMEEPDPDTNNGSNNPPDWQLLDASESDGYTALRFTRKFNTTSERDLIIANETVYLLWAVGDDDNITDHRDKRGSESVNFLEEIFDDSDDGKSSTKSTSPSGNESSESTTSGSSGSNPFYKDATRLLFFWMSLSLLLDFISGKNGD